MTKAKSKAKLNNQPIKGTADWFPEEFVIRKYIFDTWRRVCKQFGYEEYLTPLVENADLYRAKSGEDVGGTELTVFTDRGGRDLAIRPEMTPSVTRMVSQRYTSLPKPIRLFSIANFFRNEKPQRGRNREFWQLNYDVFGSNSVYADVEILQVGLEIMLSFNPPPNSFVAYVNSRTLIDLILDSLGISDGEIKVKLMRILDKWDKEGEVASRMRLGKVGLRLNQVDGLVKLIKCASQQELVTNFPELKGSKVLKDIELLMVTLQGLGYRDWVQFKPSLIRGFDYYDGPVFEFFDQSPQNKRSLFGGGRYNALAGLFDVEPFPAVGCAPGDETTRLFLDEWNLIEQLNIRDPVGKLYLPLLGEKSIAKAFTLASKLRSQGEIVEIGLQVQNLRTALIYADKRSFTKIIFLGDEELERGIYVVRDMLTGDQEEFSFTTG
ncbi:histidine--tRNA ligase [Patescibacteria group bacterium]|nr:histidine--tRNA ligase [Patescibacteria group bacterium]MBU1867846.1 histidine--tRNA ligase [Patescibacteria group bacterium]